MSDPTVTYSMEVWFYYIMQFDNQTVKEEVSEPMTAAEAAEAAKARRLLTIRAVILKVCTEFGNPAMAKVSFLKKLSQLAK